MSFRPTILVVEDDPQVRRFLRTLLSDAGYHVRDAADAQSAREQLRSGLPPQLVLLDLTLPGLSGGDFLAELQAHPQWRELPVVTMSGDLLAEHPAGAAGRLDKPFALTELLRLTAVHCGPGERALALT